MKKILFAIMALVCCMSMSAQTIKLYKGTELVKCYDAEDVDSVVYATIKHGEDQQKANETWTVMFYSVGGGNLDTAQVKNMTQAMNSKVNEKINMTFQFIFSKNEQKLHPASLQGAFRFDMNEARQELVEKGITTFDEDGEWMEYITTYDAEVTDMTRASSLTAFIDWSTKKHPADHYLLILSDHGSGWTATQDDVITPAKGTSTTGILADDNNKDAYNNDKELSAASLEKGIKDSNLKKVDVLYTDACLMATAENIFQYSSVADYYLGAVELTPGEGGEYTQLLNMIGADSNTWTWAKNYIKYCTSPKHWNYQYADLGIYDLKKFCDENGAVVNNIKNFAKLLKEDLKGDSVQVINSAVLNSQVSYNENYACYDYKGEFHNNDIKPVNGKISAHTIYEYMVDDSVNFIANYRYYTKDYNQFLHNVQACNSCYIILADFMERVAAGMPDNLEYAKCYNEYLNALSDCSFIRFANRPDDQVAAYKHLSMSVNIFGINDVALQDWNNGSERTWLDEDGEIEYNNESRFAGESTSEVMSAYQSTRFDQMTDWCENFLSNLKVNPGVRTNRSLEGLNF